MYPTLFTAYSKLVLRHTVGSQIERRRYALVGLRCVFMLATLRPRAQLSTFSNWRCQACEVVLAWSAVDRIEQQDIVDELCCGLARTGSRRGHVLCDGDGGGMAR